MCVFQLMPGVICCLDILFCSNILHTTVARNIFFSKLPQSCVSVSVSVATSWLLCLLVSDGKLPIVRSELTQMLYVTLDNSHSHSAVI